MDEDNVHLRKKTNRFAADILSQIDREQEDREADGRGGEEAMDGVEKMSKTTGLVSKMDDG
jgi:hypothetical protein